MSKSIEEEEVYEPEEVELTPEQEAAQTAIDQLNNRLAQGFNNLAESINSILNQYSYQAQVSVELLRAEFGMAPSAEAAKYKALMDEKTEEMMAEQERLKDAEKILADTLDDLDPAAQSDQ